MIEWLVPLMLAAAPAEEIDPCAVEGACRTIEQLRLEDPEGKVSTIDLGLTLPWVAQGNVLLTPGEAVTVMLEEVDGALTPRLVRSGDAARETEPGPGEIRFDFGGFERGSLMLSVKSNYPEPLEYAALMVTLNNGPERTSVCTLNPGLTVFEQWRSPIYQMALWGFRPADDGMSCSIIDLGGEED